MRISTAKKRAPQLFEPDGRLNGSMGLIRTVLGEHAERMTARLLRGTQHKTDSRCDYCPDISIPGSDCYFEVKTAGRTNQFFIYSGRLEKDVRFATNRSLTYCVWNHSLDVAQYEFESELKAAFNSNVIAVYLIPFEQVESACRDKKPTALNSGYGKRGTKADKVYGSGYRLSLSRFSHCKI